MTLSIALLVEARTYAGRSMIHGISITGKGGSQVGKERVVSASKRGLVEMPIHVCRMERRLCGYAFCCIGHCFERFLLIAINEM